MFYKLQNYQKWDSYIYINIHVVTIVYTDFFLLYYAWYSNNLIKINMTYNMKAKIFSNDYLHLTNG